MKHILQSRVAAETQFHSIPVEPSVHRDSFDHYLIFAVTNLAGSECAYFFGLFWRKFYSVLIFSILFTPGNINA